MTLWEVVYCRYFLWFCLMKEFGLIHIKNFFFLDYLYPQTVKCVHTMSWEGSVICEMNYNPSL